MLFRSLNLEVLWLNNNKISKIEGIDHMNSLIELNLALNNIKKIGSGLSSLSNLKLLNLSANSIDKLEEITNLQALPSLKCLYLKDPQYGYSPVTVLCNYSLYTLFHLPNLLTLDTMTVSSKSIQEIADATINKKNFGIL